MKTSQILPEIFKELLQESLTGEGYWGRLLGKQQLKKGI